MTIQRGRPFKSRISADTAAAGLGGGSPSPAGAAPPWSPGFRLIHALSGPYRGRWRAIETMPGGLNLGLRGALAPCPRFCRRRAVLRDVVSNDRAGSPMEDAAGRLTGKCLGSEPKNDRDNKKPA